MDWNRNAGGREELSPFEGPQAAPGSESRVAATSASVAQRPTHCQQKSGRIGFNRWRLLHQFQQAPGLSEEAGDAVYSAGEAFQETMPMMIMGFISAVIFSSFRYLRPSIPPFSSSATTPHIYQ